MATDGYLRRTNTNNNTYWIAPNSTPGDITSDLDVRVDVALDDWTGLWTGLCGKTSDPGQNESYEFAVQGTNSGLSIRFSTDGSTWTHEVGSSVGHGIADGERAQVRATWDQATGDVVFYKRTDFSKDLSDNTGWTVVSSHPAAGPTVALASSADSFWWMRRGLGLSNPGNWYQVAVLDGIDAAPTTGNGFWIDVRTGNPLDANNDILDNRGTLWAFSDLTTKGTDWWYWTEQDHTKYVNLDGTDGYVNGPNLAATSDIIRVEVKAETSDWDPPADRPLVAHWSFSGGDTGNRQFYILNQTASFPRFKLGVRDSAGNEREHFGGGSAGLNDNEAYWLAFDLDLDNGSSQYQLSRFKGSLQGEDPGTWTGFDTDATGAIGATTFASPTSETIKIGFATLANDYWEGDIYEAIIYDGGVPIARFNPGWVDGWSSETSFTDEFGNTWTLTGGATRVGFGPTATIIAPPDDPGGASPVSGNLLIQIDAEG